MWAVAMSLMPGFMLACQREEAESGSVYYGDIDGILQQNCMRCHQDGGQARSFADPADAQAMAPNMAAYVQSGLMPPPAPDPECRDYDGSEHFNLDAEEWSRLIGWADAGALLGDPALATAPPAPDTLERYDQVLTPDLPYSPDFSAGQDDYRCFRFDMGNDAPLYLTALEALVDDLSVVHHVVLFDATGAQASEDPTGFSCDGFGEDGWSFVSGWAPGGNPLRLPEGMGLELAPQSVLVLQIHYYNSFDGADLVVDNSGYGFQVAEAVDKIVYNFPVGAFDFVIPAGNPAYKNGLIVPWQERWGRATILGVFPHMHKLGSAFDMSVAHPDGTRDCVVEMDGWDFHNQVSAMLKEPQVVEAEDTVFLECTWDNSATNPEQSNDPPQDVSWGEGTGEEMCFGFTYLTLED